MTQRPALLVPVGEAITAFMRHPGPDGTSAAFAGPFPSGAPAIFASAAARLGAPTALCAGVGRDEFGRQLVDRLDCHGVRTTHILADDSRPTSAAFVTYHPDGNREFVFYLRETAGLSYPAAALGNLPEQATWFHLSGSALAFGGDLGAAAWTALERASAAGATVSVDPNVRKEAFTPQIVELLRAAIDRADVVFASAGELEALDLDARTVVDKGAVVCAKRGADGAVVYHGPERTQVPAPEVHEVDADGAGDIFAAGYVAATMAGRDPVAAARIGCLVAAESVRTVGPMESRIQHLDRYR